MIEFLKQDKELYQPPRRPVLVDVPNLRFLQVDGTGSPDGAVYQNSVGLVYTVAYTIKMSKKGPWQPPGYEDFKVPPLEGLWDCVPGGETPREVWTWTTLLRMPDFVTEEVFAWAMDTAKAKKKDLDFSPLRFASYAEGRCVQMMHVGPYATETETLAHMQAFMAENGYADATGQPGENGLVRRHHEVYLGDPRRSAPENRKTVVRHPVRPL